MIDNFEIIRKLLKFPKPGDSFYFVQILQRNKDNPGMTLMGCNNNSRLIRAYYVESQEYLDSHKEEMTVLAKAFNARVGINLNPRSYEKTAFDTLIKLGDQMKNRDFKGVSMAYNHVCGSYQAEMDKRWLVDIDTKDQAEVDKIGSFIKGLLNEGSNQERSVLATVETRSGYHLITNPFNSEKFKAEFPGVEIHKNNPTNLFIP